MNKKEKKDEKKSTPNPLGWKMLDEGAMHFHRVGQSKLQKTPTNNTNPTASKIKEFKKKEIKHQKKIK
jgi:hypothetical protein